MTLSILGIVPDCGRAEQLLGDLRAGGFYGEEICVRFPDRKATLDFAHEHHTTAAQVALDGDRFGRGMPEHEATQYASELREGDVLVSVLVLDRERRQLAKDILELNRARHISEVGEPVPAAYRASYRARRA